MGVEEVIGGWASGVVDDFDEGVEVMGKEFAVMGVEIVIALVAGGQRLEVKIVKPLEGGGGGRGSRLRVEARMAELGRERVGGRAWERMWVL
jgi:hypothetical protein